MSDTTVMQRHNYNYNLLQYFNINVFKYLAYVPDKAKQQIFYQHNIYFNKISHFVLKKKRRSSKWMFIRKGHENCVLLQKIRCENWTRSMGVDWGGGHLPLPENIE